MEGRKTKKRKVPKPPCAKEGDFARLDFLWKDYPKKETYATFADFDSFLADHPSCEEESRPVEQEFKENHFEKFFIALSRDDLPFREHAKEEILKHGPFPKNPYSERFLAQFAGVDLTKYAPFLIAKREGACYRLLEEALKRAASVKEVSPLFPGDLQKHYLVLIPLEDSIGVTLLFHLLLGGSKDGPLGGYCPYGISLPYYFENMEEDGIPLRNPYLPDRLVEYEGGLSFHHNPAKVVQVRRNVKNILEKGYYPNEISFFHDLALNLMPFFQRWYLFDLSHLQEDEEWKRERERLRSRLVDEGEIEVKWKHEETLFHLLRERYPDAITQYRPSFLGLQSLDVYLPSLNLAVEYQGKQHEEPIPFFGGEEALEKRKKLDENKKELCRMHGVALLEWPYEIEPDETSVDLFLEKAGYSPRPLPRT